MELRDRNTDTICAISTPHGYGGISVIRLSGKQSYLITKKLCNFLPEAPETHRVYFGNLKSYVDGHIIDEVLVTFFKEGKSFTGEEVVEISSHGNPYICNQIIQELISCGARSADRGEFTFRAFMNNRLDLVQAEAVLDIINSQSPVASQVALSQLKGSISKELHQVEDEILWCLAHIEANIDFSTENLEIISNTELLTKLNSISVKLNKLLSSYNSGKILKDGFRVVFTGIPNVGKSSLLNLVVQDERSIVTNIPGTTRDIVEGDIIYEGLKFTFVDTAGLRNQFSDIVEEIGIQRSISAKSSSHVNCFIIDAGQNSLTEYENELLASFDPKNTIIIFNQTDKLKEFSKKALFECMLKKSSFYRIITQNEELLNHFISQQVLTVSARVADDRDVILGAIHGLILDKNIQSTALLSNARHFDNLSAAIEKITLATNTISKNLGAEFVSLDIKEALIKVQETIGKVFDDQILDKVFKEFCIGK